MERELWSELSAAIFDVARTHHSGRRFTHDIALIVRVYLWSVLHDRPVCWACCRQHWLPRMRPPKLPSQATLSRRTRTAAFHEFLQALGRRLAGRASAAWIKRLDGKALMVAAHSTDPQATWGHGAGQKAKGYKLHALWSNRPMPEVFAVVPLNISERQVARDLLNQLTGAGYVLADANYNDSQLFDRAAANHHQLVAPRELPGRGLGHHYQSPHRLQIERDFANAVYFGPGLKLPPFVRRLPRVTAWVTAKLLINAARIRLKRRSLAA